MNLTICKRVEKNNEEKDYINLINLKMPQKMEAKRHLCNI